MGFYLTKWKVENWNYREDIAETTPLYLQFKKNIHEFYTSKISIKDLLLKHRIFVFKCTHFLLRFLTHYITYITPFDTAGV